MKFWEFWREWGRNVLAHMHLKEMIKLSISALVLIVILLLELAGCNVLSDS